MIEIVTQVEPEVWDRYMTGHPAGRFGNSYAWAGSLAKVYDLPVRRWAAYAGSRMVGGLAAILFAPPDGLKRLISLPYSDAAGLLADDHESGRALLHAALEDADQCGAAHLELRQAGPLAGAGEGGLVDSPWTHHRYSFKTGLSLELPATVDQLWAGLTAKVRNQIRKARREGCHACLGGEELLADFYEVFATNMRDLGSPVHSRQLFVELLGQPRPLNRLIVVYCGTVPAAAAMVFQQGQTIANPWASSLRQFRPSCPNMLLYWTMLAHGVASGCQQFDFGRSTPGASTCRFKQQWGATMEPLDWHVFSRPGGHWHPAMESLVDEQWQGLDLASAAALGPARRRWISL